MQALPPPSDRAMALFFLVMVFACGVMVGAMVTATREVDRHAREAQRLIAQMPSRPPLQQQVDALAQRVQALEHRQTP